MFFLDFEASSLDSGSFPIEIGWVSDIGQGESYLIKPQNDWTIWSVVSEKIHGISRATLDANGRSAQWVAQRAYAVLNNQAIYSDNPSFDTYWFETLLSVVDLPPLLIADFDRLRAREIQRLFALIKADSDTPEWHRQSRYWSDKGESYMSGVDAREPRVQHRALSDATSLWHRWHQVKVWVDGVLTGDDGVASMASG